MMNEQSNTKISGYEYVPLCFFIPQTPPPNLFLIRLENVGLSLNASTPANSK